MWRRAKSPKICKDFREKEGSNYSYSYREWSWKNILPIKIVKWPYFAKITLGRQYIEAVDSISANIAEGWHRYFKKDKKQFFIVARASVGETKDWTKKAKIRNLLKAEEFNFIMKILENLPKEINGLIKTTLNQGP